VTTAQVREIAEKKMADLNANDIEGGDEDHCRFGPLDGPEGGGRTWHVLQTVRITAATKALIATALSAR
jgi:hypothetical protein